MRWLAAEAEAPGLGARHRAMAGITSLTKAVGVAVSGEDGRIRVFEKEKVVAVIRP
jgi:DNA integrity scanning protein DisA with diadenylate cyclase activity